MPTKLVKAILQEHGVPFRDIEGWLVVEEVFTINGKRFSIWVACPSERADLFRWLGY